jgi:DnaJ-class molecular chaperone
MRRLRVLQGHLAAHSCPAAGAGAGRGDGSSSDVDEGDLYGTLGVGRDADQSDIRKAYRKLALRHHPDKGGDADRFQRLTRAYEVLSDEELRPIYDAHGMEGVRAHEDGAQVPGAGASSSSADPFSMFEEMFGEAFAGAHRRGGAARRRAAHCCGCWARGQVPQRIMLRACVRVCVHACVYHVAGRGSGRRPRPPREQTFKLKCGLADVYNGKAFSVGFERRAACVGCDGSGVSDGGTRAEVRRVGRSGDWLQWLKRLWLDGPSGGVGWDGAERGRAAATDAGWLHPQSSHGAVPTICLTRCVSVWQAAVACGACGGSGWTVGTQRLGGFVVQRVRVQCEACGGAGKVLDPVI